MAAGTPQIDRDLDDIRSEVESLAKHVMPNRSTDSLMNEYIGLCVLYSCDRNSPAYEDEAESNNALYNRYLLYNAYSISSFS